jgi:hypothetical protein
MLNKEKLENILKTKTKDLGSYSLDESNGYYMDDAICLREVYGKWLVFYCERGNYIGEKEFDNENDACEYFLETFITT